MQKHGVEATLLILSMHDEMVNKLLIEKLNDS